MKEAYYRADGTQRQAHYADGSNDYYDAAGVLLEPHPQPNGDVWYVDTQGRTERVDHADGCYELSSFAVDGSYVAHGFDAQGVEVRQVAHDPAGLVLWTREVVADGSFTVTYASGLVDRFRSDMTLWPRGPWSTGTPRPTMLTGHPTRARWNTPRLLVAAKSSPGPRTAATR